MSECVIVIAGHDVVNIGLWINIFHSFLVVAGVLLLFVLFLLSCVVLMIFIFEGFFKDVDFSFFFEMI